MITTSKTQLLATKILTPKCGPVLIDRPRLLDVLMQVESKQVAVTKAGWFRQDKPGSCLGRAPQKSGKSVAWLALDGNDQAIHRFLWSVGAGASCQSC
jgi:ATP/maltotriose-dependent transcriptional regulator MalT